MNVARQVRRLIEAEEFEQAIAALQPLAERGDADAQFLLGYLYFGGADDEQMSPEQAQHWLRRAAAQNHAEACYYLSRWSEQDDPSDLLHKAARLGSASAQYALGAMYATGNCVPVDGAQSRRWYALAAAQNNPEAQYNLGLMLLDGEGGAVNEEQGLAWLEKAALTSVHDPSATAAANVLAGIHEQGQYGVEARSEAASRWKQRAKERHGLDERHCWRSHPDWFYENETD